MESREDWKERTGKKGPGREDREERTGKRGPGREDQKEIGKLDKLNASYTYTTNRRKAKKRSSGRI